MSRGGMKTYSRQKVCQSNIQFDQLLNDKSNKPSAAKSKGTLHRWGMTSFTSVRNASQLNGGRKDRAEGGAASGTGAASSVNRLLSKRRRVNQPPAASATPTEATSDDPFSFEAEADATLAAAAARSSPQSAGSTGANAGRFPPTDAAASRSNKFFKSGARSSAFRAARPHLGHNEVYVEAVELPVQCYDAADLINLSMQAPVELVKQQPHLHHQAHHQQSQPPVVHDAFSMLLSSTGVTSDYDQLYSSLGTIKQPPTSSAASLNLYSNYSTAVPQQPNYGAGATAYGSSAGIFTSPAGGISHAAYGLDASYDQAKLAIYSTQLPITTSTGGHHQAQVAFDADATELLYTSDGGRIRIKEEQQLFLVDHGLALDAVPQAKTQETLYAEQLAHGLASPVKIGGGEVSTVSYNDRLNLGLSVKSDEALYGEQRLSSVDMSHHKVADEVFSERMTVNKAGGEHHLYGERTSFAHKSADHEYGERPAETSKAVGSVLIHKTNESAFTSQRLVQDRVQRSDAAYGDPNSMDLSVKAPDHPISYGDHALALELASKTNLTYCPQETTLDLTSPTKAIGNLAAAYGIPATSGSGQASSFRSRPGTDTDDNVFRKSFNLGELAQGCGGGSEGKQQTDYAEQIAFELQSSEQGVDSSQFSDRLGMGGVPIGKSAEAMASYKAELIAAYERDTAHAQLLLDAGRPRVTAYPQPPVVEQSQDEEMAAVSDYHPSAPASNQYRSTEAAQYPPAQYRLTDHQEDAHRSDASHPPTVASESVPSVVEQSHSDSELHRDAEPDAQQAQHTFGDAMEYSSGGEELDDDDNSNDSVHRSSASVSSGAPPDKEDDGVDSGDDSRVQGVLSETSCKQVPPKKSYMMHQSRMKSSHHSSSLLRQRRIFNSPKKIDRKSLYKHRPWQVEEENADDKDVPSTSSSQPTLADEFDDIDDEVSAQKPTLTRVTTWPTRLGDEAVTSVRCPKKFRELYAVVKNVKQAHQCHESGETQEFNDDIEYLLDGVQGTNSVDIRCLSILSLASKCMAPSFRMHLRAHGSLTKVFSALQDAPKDANLSLCTATVMFILSQDRLNMDLDRTSLELMLQLLETESSVSMTAISTTNGHSREYDKNKEKVRELCQEQQKKGYAKLLDLENITPGVLAMETLLSLTSRRAGEWFKEELRELGGLDHLVNTVEECGKCLPIIVIDLSEFALNKLRKLDRCLRVLENVTYMNSQNQAYLITCQNASLIHYCSRALQLCEKCLKVYPNPDINDRESSSWVLFNCLLSVLKVLLNLTNDNPRGSTVLGTQDGLIIAALSCVLSVPSHCETEQRFDILVLSLGLLINLVEHSDANRHKVLYTDLPAIHQSSSHHRRHPEVISAPKALANLFMEHEEAARLEETKTDNLLDGKGDGEGETATPQKDGDPAAPGTSTSTGLQADEIEETLQKALQKAGKNMENSMIAAYIALLLGCLIQENRDNANKIRDHLPQKDFGGMVQMLKKYLNFMNLTNLVGSKGMKSIQRVIDILENT